MKIVRIYTGDDGESHFEDVEISLADDGFGGVISEPVKAKSVMFRETGGQYNLDYHNAPRRQYVIILSGQLETGFGDGSKRVFGPGDARLVEDITGQGHTTGVYGDQPCVTATIPLANQ